VCSCNPEDQPYAGLHQKKRGQQVEGGDSAPLFCSGETPSGVLCPALEPSAQERHGPVAASPEEDHKNDQRDGTLLNEERLRDLRLFILEKRRLWEDLLAAFLYLKRAYRKAGEVLFTTACSYGTRGKTLN